MQLFSKVEKSLANVQSPKCRQTHCGSSDLIEMEKLCEGLSARALRKGLPPFSWHQAVEICCRRLVPDHSSWIRVPDSEFRQNVRSEFKKPIFTVFRVPPGCPYFTSSRILPHLRRALLLYAAVLCPAVS